MDKPPPYFPKTSRTIMMPAVRQPKPLAKVSPPPRPTRVLQPRTDLPEDIPESIRPPPVRQWDRKITLPVMAAVRGMPNDLEVRAAQPLLDHAATLQGHIDVLMGFPAWVPISEPLMALTKEVKRYRQMAASLLHCDPTELEGDD